MEKFLKVLIKNTPLAIIIIGLFLLVVGAAGGLQKYSLNIEDVRWRIILGVMGAVVAGFGGLLTWRGTGEAGSSSLAKECGLKIVAPIDGTEVDQQVQMAGTFEKKPPDKRLAFIEQSMTTGNYYFKRWPIHFSENKQWSAECHIGGGIGAQRRVHVAILGTGGQALRDYYFRVVSESGKWPGIETLPPDISLCASVRVKRKAPAGGWGAARPLESEL
jgi:hypothetical protein